MPFRIRNRLQRGALVLMYHRIASSDCDPWDLAVSPTNFEGHLKILTKHEIVLSLNELLAGRKTMLSLKNRVAITFDDGYADNYIIAKPLLEQYKLPATFFIAHQNIDMAKEYWWDELERILLHRIDLPKELIMVINGEQFSYETEPYKHSETVDTYFGKPAKNIPNLDLYISLWRLLQPLPMQEQQQILSDLRAWAGAENVARKEYCCMNRQQLVDLSKTDQFEIGMHTITHPALSFHSKAFQEKELATNKKWLENMTGRRMRYCAYPYGNYNATTVSVLKELNVNAAVTTKPGLIARKTEKLELGRFQVKNWNGNEFEKQLLSWMKGH